MWLCVISSPSISCLYYPVQLAESAIFSMSKLAPPPGVGGVVVQEVQWGQQLEEVQLHWALGETSLALQTLRDTTQRLEQVWTASGYRRSFASVLGHCDVV